MGKILTSTRFKELNMALNLKVSEKELRRLKDRLISLLEDNKNNDPRMPESERNATDQFILKLRNNTDNLSSDRIKQHISIQQGVRNTALENNRLTEEIVRARSATIGLGLTYGLLRRRLASLASNNTITSSISNNSNDSLNNTDVTRSSLHQHLFNQSQPSYHNQSIRPHQNNNPRYPRYGSENSLNNNNENIEHICEYKYFKI